MAPHTTLHLSVPFLIARAERTLSVNNDVRERRRHSLSTHNIIRAHSVVTQLVDDAIADAIVSNFGNKEGSQAQTCCRSQSIGAITATLCLFIAKQVA
jgi:hypothetical protein